MRCVAAAAERRCKHACMHGSCQAVPARHMGSTFDERGAAQGGRSTMWRLRLPLRCPCCGRHCWRGTRGPCRCYRRCRLCSRDLGLARQGMQRREGRHAGGAAQAGQLAAQPLRQVQAPLRQRLITAGQRQAAHGEEQGEAGAGQKVDQHAELQSRQRVGRLVLQLSWVVGGVAPLLLCVQEADNALSARRLQIQREQEGRRTRREGEGAACTAVDCRRHHSPFACSPCHPPAGGGPEGSVPPRARRPRRPGWPLPRGGRASGWAQAQARPWTCLRRQPDPGEEKRNRERESRWLGVAWAPRHRAPVRRNGAAPLAHLPTRTDLHPSPLSPFQPLRLKARHERLARQALATNPLPSSPAACPPQHSPQARSKGLVARAASCRRGAAAAASAAERPPPPPHPLPAARHPEHPEHQKWCSLGGGRGARGQTGAAAAASTAVAIAVPGTERLVPTALLCRRMARGGWNLPPAMHRLTYLAGATRCRVTEPASGCASRPRSPTAPPSAAAMQVPLLHPLLSYASTTGKRAAGRAGHRCCTLTLRFAAHAAAAAALHAPSPPRHHPTLGRCRRASWPLVARVAMAYLALVGFMVAALASTRRSALACRGVFHKDHETGRIPL